MALQADLGRRIATTLGGARSTNSLSASQILAIESEFELFIGQLPEIFKVERPDTSYDEEYPHIVFQRRQLHCVIFATRLDLMKPFLTRDREDKMTEKDDTFREMGVGIALRLLHMAQGLFDHEFPINTKFHLVIFAIFDVSG
jgi:hypothetical protein